MILIFTGNGKGKTTAALGQAVRAIGNGKKVLMIQFIKGPFKSGEDYFAEKFSRGSTSGSLEVEPREKDLQIMKTGRGFVGILGDKLPFSEHKKAAQKGLELATKAINPPVGGEKYDLIILDEINNAVDLKLVKAVDVLKIIKGVSEKTDIILTGRNAPKSFIKIADIVTEMKEVKHIFNKNKHSMKKGIEY